MLCKCPRLRSLQLRYAASFATLLVFGVLSSTVSNPHFAYAADVNLDQSGGLKGGEDHNWHRIEELRLVEDGVDVALGDGAVADNDGVILGTMTITARAAATTTGQIAGNDVPNEAFIDQGATATWTYLKQYLTEQPAPKGSGFPGSRTRIRSLKDPEHVDLRRRDSNLAEGDANPDSADFVRRQTESTAFISINTCTQPQYVGSEAHPAAPPQLTLYVAESTTSVAQAYPLDEGFANTSYKTSGDLYVYVGAPTLPQGFNGSWSYELAVSTTDYYHAYSDAGMLLLVDTDTAGALLVTANLTQENSTTEVYREWMDFTDPLPYTIFTSNTYDTNYMGLTKSFCGIRSSTQIQGDLSNPYSPSAPVQMGMTNRSLSHLPLEYFHMHSLNASSNYTSWLAVVGNGTRSGSGVVGGGGTVFNVSANYLTKTDGNCALLYNLSFCDDVAYAVPANPTKYNFTQLQSLYDDSAMAMYTNFTYSMQQIACNTTSDAQYSLAKTCDDCYAAYKQWMCAVMIPRCEDFSRNESYLQPRNMGQAFYNNGSFLASEVLNAPYTPMSNAPTLPGSPAYQQTFASNFGTNGTRNPDVIQAQIMPGPYREVKPCDDLCYELVRSCPASLGFGCPLHGRGLEASYGTRNSNAVTCSYPGAVYAPNGAGGLTPTILSALLVASITGLALGLI